MWSYVTTTLLMLCGLLLWIIILLQRGRGGGLAGAFGGLGGQSAFGTKAGDVFTKITIVLTLIWVLLAGVSSLAMQSESSRRYKSDTKDAPSVDAPEGAKDDGIGDDLSLPEGPSGSLDADKKGSGSDAATSPNSGTDDASKKETSAPAETSAADSKKQQGDKSTTPTTPDAGKSPSK